MSSPDEMGDPALRFARPGWRPQPRPEFLASAATRRRAYPRDILAGEYFTDELADRASKDAAIANPRGVDH
jgi:hypothetical protein